MSKNKKNTPAAEEAEKPAPDVEENTADAQTSEDAQADTTQEEPAVNKSDEQIEELQKQLKNEQDKYMRLFAEFDNFRKRTSKEKTEAYGDATAKTIGELLPALDNFERALDTPCSDENFKKGIDMIFSQLTGILEKIGVSEIDALNQPFDPKYHNAIKQAESDELEPDTVCEVFQKGYKLGDRIIRHSMVSVTA